MSFFTRTKLCEVPSESRQSARSLSFNRSATMSTVCYITGEAAKVGDIVVLAGQKGKITIVGDGLLEWGLTAEEIKEGRVMIEFENGGLLCTDAASEDLNLITQAK